MEQHRRRELSKIRQSFLERYKLAKQIRDIDEELEEKE